MKNYLFIAITTLFLFTLSTGISFAAYPSDTNCQPIYGGGETCEPGVSISVDKKVIHPITGQEVDNLNINDPKFKPGQEIRFNIYVTNTGTDELNDITITDTMAEFTKFTSSNIMFDIDNSTLTSQIGSLRPGVTKIFQIKAKIVGVGSLPEDQGIACDVNTVGVTVGDLADEDTAGFCIQKDVLPVATTPSITKGGQPAPTTLPAKTIVIPRATKGGQPVYEAPTTEKTPSTGPELFGLVGLIPTALGGLFLRSKIK